MNKDLLRQYFVAVFTSATFVFIGSLLAPVEIRFVESITASTTVSGLIFGSASLGLTFVSFYIARLSKRIGRRRMLLLGSVFGIMYALTYASVFNTLGLFGVKFAWVFAIAATRPIIAAYIQSTLFHSPKKGRYFGYLYATEAIAGSIGALLGGLVFEHFGFNDVVLLVALAYIFVIIVISFLPETEHKEENKTVSLQETNQMSFVQLLPLLIKKPQLRFYIISNIAFSLNWGVKAFLWPLIIISIGGTDAITGSIFATMGLVAFFLLPSAGTISDRLGPYKVILISLVVFILTGTVLVSTHDIIWFWVAAAFYTIAEVLNGPAQATILTDELPEESRGEAIALDTSLDQILSFSAPLLAGFLASMYSPSTALGVFVAAFVVALFFTTRIFKQQLTIKQYVA